MFPGIYNAYRNLAYRSRQSLWASLIRWGSTLKKRKGDNWMWKTGTPVDSEPKPAAEESLVLGLNRGKIK